MMRRLMIMLLALAVVTPSFATYCPPKPPKCSVGPKGDKGDKGAKGDKGDKGFKGDTGASGINGKDGKDASRRTGIGVEGVIRVKDSKHTVVELFDAYDLRARHNHFAGVRLTWKLGKSWEQKRREELERQLSETNRNMALLRADLSKRNRPVAARKSVRKVGCSCCKK